MTNTISPKVSVVVPTYNRRELIGETLQSVLSQTYDKIELIVVDDGSTDETREYVLDTFGDDLRLRYLQQPNGERAVARNRGIRESRGDFVAFVDSDDVWMPTKLERQMTALSALGAPKCCYCLSGVLANDGRQFDCGPPPPSGDVFEPLLSKCFIGSMTPVVQRKCFDTVGLFCENRSLLCFEDWEMWTRLASAFHWLLVPEMLGQHRLHAGNSQHAADLKVDELRMDLMKKYVLSQNHRRALQRYVSGRSWHWATSVYDAEPWKALRLMAAVALTDKKRLVNRSFWGLALKAITIRRTELAEKKRS